MKKMLFIIWAMLLSAAANAQHWTFDENQWNSETVVYCDLVSQDANASIDPLAFEVAAFIDGEVRAVATAVQNQAIATHVAYYFRMRVKGDLTDDNGKSITFKAYNTETQLEYDATLVESPLPITFDGETKDPGIPSNLRHLYLTEVTAISLPEVITIAKGETVDLLPYITVSPDGAKLSETATYVWDFANSATYISVEDNALTGLQGTDGAYLGLRVGTLSAYTTVVVTNPATDLTILDNFKEISVNKGDNATLTKLIESSYELTPADASDQVVWVIGDESIIQDMAPAAYGWNPIAAGTTTMTAQILNSDGSVRLSATLTVHVVVPVERVWFDFEDTIGYMLKYVECNVGDDLDSFLKQHVQVLPEDATNKNVVWSLVDGNSISIDAQGKITVVAAGTSTVRVASAEDDSKYYDMMIIAHKPATDVEFAEETLSFTYAGETLTISDEVAANITLLPTDFETIEQFSVTSDAEDVVLVGGASVQENNDGTHTVNLRAQAYQAGEATITVSFSYTNWLATYTNPNGDNTVSVEKTFKIVVNESKELTGFIIENGELVFGEEAEIYLEPQPNSAEFDVSKVTVVLRSQNDLPESWAKSFTGGSVDANGMVNMSVTPHVPGLVSIVVYYDGEEVSASEAEVPVRLDLSSGWQWRTLFYGDIESGYMQEAFGGNSLVEVRSQTELLYNDPTYGYFGELADNGLRQDVCYKVKMNAAQDSYLIRNGYFVFGWENDLNAGWTWVPNSYFYRRSLSHISGASEGDRIVSKDSGFAEYDGTKWTGSLTMLEPGEGYLYYSENTGLYNLDSEFNLAPANDDDSSTGVVPGGNAKRFAHGQANSPWQYDASQWRDNMSVVAVAENADDLADYSVGAFVGDECRGEGVLVDGKLFLTVHGKAGETVTFRFYAPFSGETFEAEETMAFQTATGSLKAPVKITKIGQTTGIGSVQGSESTGQHSVFNANGVRQQQLQRGLNIVRSADGRIRKVVVK